MRPDDASDPLLRAMAHLPALTSDATRDARVRARCHAALAARRPQRVAVDKRRRRVRGLGPACVGLLCALYLVSVIGEALRLGSF